MQALHNTQGPDGTGQNKGLGFLIHVINFKRDRRQLAKKDVQIADRLNLLDYRVLEEFYDVQNDPDCLHNLIDDPAYRQEIKEYRGLLEEWLRKVDDPLLLVFQQREDSTVLTEYMREQILKTNERKKWQRAILQQRQEAGT